MQLALHPSAAAGLNPDSPWAARKNKILVGSVVALSASVIAISPAAQNGVSLELHKAEQRAVQMAAAVTDSPIAVYGDLLSNTLYNLNGLVKTYAADPLPILSAVISNQVGYLKRIFDFSTASTAFKTWWESGSRESAPGKDLLASVGTALAKGDIGLAYENFNKLTLFGIQNTVLPWLNGWFFGTATQPSIFTQMAQNLTDASTAFFSTGTLVYGAFQAVYAPFSGAAFELSQALGSFGSSLRSGNIVAAITALVNTPGAVLNAFLNGFDYSATQNPWAGLLSWRDPSCTGRCASGGPISEFLITIARKIATAVKNVTTTSTATAAVAAASATTATDSTTADVASAAVVPASNTVTLTVTDVAAESTEAATDTASTPAAETDTATAAETTESTTAATETATEDTTATTPAADTTKTAESTTAADPTDSTAADSTKTDTKADTTKADSTKSDSTQADSTKADTTKSGSKHGTKKGGTTKSETATSGDTTKADPPKVNRHSGTRHAGAGHSSEGASSASSSSSSSSSGGSSE